MASNFDKYIYEPVHGVAESTLMLATMAGGHFYNVVNEEVDMDNGSLFVLKPENYTEQDVFKVAVPTIKDKVCLLLNPPKIYEEYTKRMQEESQYFLGKGERGRGYEVFDTDRFTLSVEAFNEDATPEVGKYVVVDGVGFKPTTTDKDPNATAVTNAFVGYIYAQAPNGNWRIFVKRNRDVE